MSDNLKDRIARMRAWQAFETEDFRASDLEAVLSAAETLADQGEPQITNEMVEAGARAFAELKPGEDWPSNGSLGGNPTGTRDDEYRAECREIARAVLEAALGVGEHATAARREER